MGRTIAISGAAVECALQVCSAVPFNVIRLPGKSDPIILSELLTPSTVLEALQKG